MPAIGIGIGTPFTGGRGGGVARNHLIAARASYLFSGQAAATKVAKKLAAASGSFAFTGQAATLAIRNRVLAAGAGAFAMTGQAATLSIGAAPGHTELNAQAGSFIFSGDTMTPAKDYLLPAGAASFAVSGSAVTLKRALKLSAAAGAFTFTGQTATLTKSASGPPTLNLVQTGGLTDAGADKTFSGASIGTAVSTRQVFIAISGLNGGGGSLPTSFTFTPNSGSPVTATLIEGQALGASVWGFIYQANVPTGTTVDGKLSFPGNPFTNFTYALYYADGATMSSTTPTDHKKTTGASGTSSLTVNLNATAGGFIIACSGYAGTPGGITTTWSGGETYNNRADSSSSGVRHSFADKSNITGSATDAVTATWSASSAAVQLVAAAWR